MSQESVLSSLEHFLILKMIVGHKVAVAWNSFKTWQNRFLCWVVDRRIFCTLTQKKRWKGSCFQLCASYIGAFICHQMWLWDIFQYFPKPGNVHPFTRCLELGSLRIDLKKVINLLMPLNVFSVFTIKRRVWRSTRL